MQSVIWQLKGKQPVHETMQFSKRWLGWLTFPKRYSFAHNHGSVENGGIYKVTVLLETSHFHGTMITGGRVDTLQVTNKNIQKSPPKVAGEKDFSHYSIGFPPPRN